MPLPAAILLWKHLKERVDPRPLEDPVDRVGVLSGERLRVCERLGLDDDEAAGLVGQRTCQNHPPLSVQRFHASEVGGPVNLALSFSLRPIEAEDDEFHGRREKLSARFTDRKSTRLNSSHVRISYAVFCLKKKNKT